MKEVIVLQENNKIAEAIVFGEKEKQFFKVLKLSASLKCGLIESLF
jgi:hypothetical protein